MHQTLQQDKFNDTDFKYDKISFKFQSKQIPDKFQGTAFKYENIIFKFQSNKTNSRISNMTMILSNYSPQIRKLGIFVLSFKDF